MGTDLTWITPGTRAWWERPSGIRSPVEIVGMCDREGCRLPDCIRVVDVSEEHAYAVAAARLSPRDLPPRPVSPAERAVLDAARAWGRARAAFDSVPDPDEDSPEFIRSGEAYAALGRAVAALLAEEVADG